MRQTFVIRCVFLLLIFLSSSLAGAADNIRQLQAGKDLSNIAYATFLGTGFYSVSGADIQVYHIPLSYHVRRLSDDDTGLKLKFPVTVGYFDFNLVEHGIPSDMASVSFVPGVEYQFRMTPDWSLMPYLDLGYATLISQDESSYVYATGIKSYFDFGIDVLDLTLGNEVYYAGYNQTDGDLRDDFAALETGLDIRYDWDVTVFGRESFISVYLANTLYFDDLRFFEYVDDPVTVTVQNEIGITLGLEAPERFWLFDLHDARIGIGYRAGDQVNVIRILFGTPF